MSEKMFKISQAELDQMLRCVGFIDDARDALAAKGPGNEAIVDDLRKSTNGIAEILTSLEVFD
jgi:hypothetical protein